MGEGEREKQDLQDSLSCPTIHFAPTYISNYNMVFGPVKFRLTSCEEKALRGKNAKKKRCSIIVEVALCTYRSLL